MLHLFLQSLQRLKLYLGQFDPDVFGDIWDEEGQDEFEPQQKMLQRQKHNDQESDEESVLSVLSMSSLQHHGGHGGLPLFPKSPNKRVKGFPGEFKDCPRLCPSEGLHSLCTNARLHSKIW